MICRPKHNTNFRPRTQYMASWPLPKNPQIPMRSTSHTEPADSTQKAAVAEMPNTPYNHSHLPAHPKPPTCHVHTAPAPFPRPTFSCTITLNTQSARAKDPTHSAPITCHSTQTQTRAHQSRGQPQMAAARQPIQHNLTPL